MKDSLDAHSDSGDTIKAQAAAWLAERDSGMSEETARAFELWRSKDVRHETAVARLEKTWESLQRLRHFRPEARMHPDCDLLARPRSVRSKMTPLLALAAALAVVVGIVAWRSMAQPTSTYVTAAAGYQHVLLADGSVMELRAETEVRVRLGQGERRVQLERGEAHFTVAKDPDRPFFVTAGDLTIRAVGTAFNVVRSDAKVEVLVTEGRVKIEPTAEASRKVVQEAPNIEAGERAVLVMPSTRPREAEPSHAALVVEKLAPEKIRELLAWQGPRLVFFETPLSEVIAEFNRHNTMQLVLKDAELGTIPVGGSFRAENLDAFVRLLSSGNDIEVHRSGQRIELRRPRHNPR